MTRADQRAETERLIRQARYGKRKLAVTRLPAAAREHDSKTFTLRGGRTVHDDERDPERVRLDRIARSIQR